MQSSQKKIPEQKKAIESLQKLAEEYLSGWRRTKADFENYKKKQAEWADSFRLTANENIISEIIPVIDNFELALAHLPQNPEEKSWSEGIIHIKRQLEEILSKNNVKKMNVKTGDFFDPNIHECINNPLAERFPEEKKSISKNQKNELLVKEVVLSGYFLGSKTLRPAKVTVETREKGEKEERTAKKLDS